MVTSNQYQVKQCATILTNSFAGDGDLAMPGPLGSSLTLWVVTGISTTLGKPCGTDPGPPDDSTRFPSSVSKQSRKILVQFPNNCRRAGLVPDFPSHQWQLFGMGAETLRPRPTLCCGWMQWFRQTAEKLLQQSRWPASLLPSAFERPNLRGLHSCRPNEHFENDGIFLFRPIHSPESLRLGLCADQHRANHHDRGFRICDGVQDSIQFASSQRLH
ncbi:hypothetical protein BT67DRAFT_90842 [Trichocladium antarcticum]|uniref:Uncharacterized protein n=1 Tax=Trichocladium antarcticum TaxID=1450529 RepID=A0AAN6ZBH1_9PEZI|nr:hypothetical protein BT67DRAFT_90842 [Trichocladium antarcticum]